MTLTQAQTKLDALFALKTDISLRRVSFSDRNIEFSSAKELMDQINYWQRIVSTLQRKAAGRSKHSFGVATF